MEQKKRNGHARHGKRLLGLLMALAMLGVLFMPVYATNDAESTEPAETAATATYNFYVNDEVYNTQTLTDGEELQKPDDPAPTQENTTFADWFTAADEAGEEFTAFGPVTVEEDKTVNLYAHWTTEPAPEQPADEQPTEDKPADETPDEETPTDGETPATTPEATTTPDTLETPDDAANEPVAQVNYDNATVEIANNIKANGTLVAKISVGGVEQSVEDIKSAGYTIAWKKNGTLVERKEVTNNVYNMAEDGSWVNVVYDKGAQATYTAVLKKADGAETVTSLGTKVSYYDSLQNGSFEEPQYTSGYGGWSGIMQIPQGKVPGWSTTASDGKIEIGDITNSNTQGWYHCNSAIDGTQIAELNCESAGALYQDVLTEPGSTMNWKLSHRGREGSDTMALVIAPLSEVENITTQEQLIDYIKGKIGDTLRADNGVTNGNTFIQTFTDGNKAWSTKRGTITVPQGQFLTRFFFVAIEAVGGNTQGNFLDDVWFSTQLPPPDPGKGRVTVVKKIYGLDQATAESELSNRQFIRDDKGNYATLNNWTTETVDNETYVKATYVFDDITVPVGKGVTLSYTEEVEKAQVNNYTLNLNGNVTQNVTLTKEHNTDEVTFTNGYTPNTANLTITKIVTGSLGDKTKKFSFSYKYDDGEETTFALADNETKLLTDIPVGTAVTITEADYETNDNYTTSYSTDGGTNYTQERTCTVTITAGDNAVIFKNHKDVTPDMGVLLDSMPYVIILIIVAAGIVGGVVLKKHKHGEDDV